MSPETTTTDTTERWIDDLDIPSRVSTQIHSTPPDTVAGEFDDDELVQECVDDAIEHFHGNLTEDRRGHIKQKWGLSDGLIDARKIGYVESGNGVVEHLVENGHDPITILRAGLGTHTILNHVFRCGGVTKENAEHDTLASTPLAPDHNKVTDCNHTMPIEFDLLSLGVATGQISEPAVNIRTLVESYNSAVDYIDGETSGVRSWWGDRITFPYRDSDGRFCYLIARSTPDTGDRVYSNGVTDRSDASMSSLESTVIANGLDFDDDVLEEYVVRPSFGDVYADAVPELSENGDPTAVIHDTIATQRNTDTDNERRDESLRAVGLMYDPDEKHRDTPTVSVDIRSHPPQNAVAQAADVGGEYDTPVVSPPVVGVQPGVEVEIYNGTDVPLEFTIHRTPSNIGDDDEYVWWDDATISPGETITRSCTTTGDEPAHGMYKYTVEPTDATGEVPFEQRKGMILAYSSIRTTTRNNRIERWVSDAPNFDVDVAKYLKQTIDRGWVNRDVITEPIFGTSTVHETKPLIVTEGITDALMAHQHGFPCVTPATTSFKKKHYEKLCELAARASTVYVVNDNEETNAGINGALRTAVVIKNDGHDVFVGELPRPSEREKIDVADFLAENTRGGLLSVLEESVDPEEHELYDPTRHNPAYTSTPQRSGSGDVDREVAGGDISDDLKEAIEEGRTSALYGLTLGDVIDFANLDTSSGAGALYRGPNPLGHHGNSTGYFVIRDHGEFVTAKDYKIESGGDGFYYNALTWLAVAAGCECGVGDPCTCTRSSTKPMGKLSHKEIWWAWKHAKEQSHIDLPEDDRIPTKALWGVAEYHGLLPEDNIPDSFDDDLRLPPSVYNNVLSIIEDEYGLNTGRERLSVSE